MYTVHNGYIHIGSWYKYSHILIIFTLPPHYPLSNFYLLVPFYLQIVCLCLSNYFNKNFYNHHTYFSLYFCSTEAKHQTESDGWHMLEERGLICYFYFICNNFKTCFYKLKIIILSKWEWFIFSLWKYTMTTVMFGECCFNKSFPMNKHRHRTDGWIQWMEFSMMSSDIGWITTKNTEIWLQNAKYKTIEILSNPYLK